MHTASTSMTDYFNCFWPVQVSTYNTRLSFFDQKLLFTDLKKFFLVSRSFPALNNHPLKSPWGSDRFYLSRKQLEPVLRWPSCHVERRSSEVWVWSEAMHQGSVWAYTCLKALKENWQTPACIYTVVFQNISIRLFNNFTCLSIFCWNNRPTRQPLGFALAQKGHGANIDVTFDFRKVIHVSYQLIQLSIRSTVYFLESYSEKAERDKKSTPVSPLGKRR